MATDANVIRSETETRTTTEWSGEQSTDTMTGRDSGTDHGQVNYPPEGSNPATNRNGDTRVDMTRPRAQSGRSTPFGLPHGNSALGKVGQGHIAGMPAGPPSNVGIVDARIDIHGDDGRTYQAPAFYKQYEDLRALRIGQRVCFKPWFDDAGYWAFDVTLLNDHQVAGARSS